VRVVWVIADERDAQGDWGRGGPYFGPAPDAIIQSLLELDSGLEFHAVCCVKRPVGPSLQLADAFWYHPVEVHGGYRRSLFIESAFKVRNIIRSISPDLVLGQGTEEYQGLCAAFSGYPNCITVHGNMRAVARRLKYLPFPQMAITAVAESIALRKTDVVICNSSYTEKCVGRLNHSKVCIPNAVRASFFEIAERRQRLMPHAPRSLHFHVPVLLCIGDILPYKNQIGLINALDSLAQKCRFRVIFAGRCGRQTAYERRFMAAVSSRSWCRYAGYRPLENLLDDLTACDAVVHPTLEDSFGLAVAEAQAAGVPVAASRVGGIVDLIEHGSTGLLFDPFDPADIRARIEELLDSERVSKLAIQAREFAEAEYRPAVIARKHLDVYTGIIHGH
jgi:glycosyltransferase involved in cell wall biosynthesis